MCIAAIAVLSPKKLQPVVIHAPIQRPVPEYDEVPDILPGSSYAKLVSILGRETERDSNMRTWKRKAFEVWVELDSKSISRSVVVTVNPSHAAQTSDGIILGKDTLETFHAKLGSRVAESGENIDSAEDHWSLEQTLSAYPESKFVRSYSWHLDNFDSPRDPTPGDFKGIPVSGYIVSLKPTTSQ